MAASLERPLGFNQADGLTTAMSVLRFPAGVDEPESYRGNSIGNDLETDTCFEAAPVQLPSSYLPENHFDSRRSNQNSMTRGLSYNSGFPHGTVEQHQLQHQQSQIQESIPNQSRQGKWSRLQSGQPIQQQFRLYDHYSTEHQTPYQGQRNTQGTPVQQHQPSLYQGTWTSTTGSDDNKSLNLTNSRYPNYKQTAVRRSSFNAWPSRLKPSKLMAEAGFFSANAGDSVRCYHCGIGLRNWDPEDDPWVEHARWSPKCEYVQHEKGQEFISLVQAAVRQAEVQEALQENATLYQPKTEDQSNSSDVQEDGSRLHKNSKTDTAIKSSTKFTSEELQNPLQTCCAQSVLAMGYKPKVVLKAIDRVVQQKGWDNLSGENIMKVIFDMEDNHEIESIEEDKVDNHKEAKVTEKEPSNVPDTADRTQLVAENEELKDRTRCKICCENSVSIVFLPCGHLVCCAQCAPALKKCAICRKEIKGTVRVCLS